jgi:hypothetical protein
VDGLYLIADGPQEAQDPVDLAVVPDIRHGRKTVLAAHAGPCIRHGQAPVALQAPVGVLDLVLRGPDLALGLVLVRLAREDRVVRVV